MRLNQILYKEHIIPDEDVVRKDAAQEDRVDSSSQLMSVENRDISVDESSNESIYSDNDMKTHNVVGWELFLYGS